MKKTVILPVCLLVSAFMYHHAHALPMSDQAFIRFVQTAAPKQVQKAIADGANVNARDICDMTPLMWAATKNNDPEVLRILLKAGAQVDAVTNESSYMGNEPGLTALFFAAVNSKNSDKCAVLLEAGADANAKTTYNRHTPFQYAAGVNPCVDILRLLIKAGADVNHSDHIGRTSLMDAVRWNTPEVVSFLLEQGADANKQDYEGESALTLSATCDQWDKMIPLLLKGGADPNRRRKMFNQTAFSYLCRGVNAGIVELLIKAGADVKATDNEDNTVLHWACMSQQSKLATGVVDTLLKHGIDANAAGTHGETAMMMAVRYDLPDILPLLIKAGGDFNRRDKDGDTALIKAVQGGSYKSVIILLEAGADKTIRNNKGMTAFDQAKDPDLSINKYPAVVKMLRP